MINIPEVEYKVNMMGTGSNCARKELNLIRLGMPQGHGLTDEEIIQYNSDTITHEFLHHVFDYIFEREISFLFDTIGEKLNEHPKLLPKLLRNSHSTGRPWSKTIEEEGMKGFIASYGLNKYAIDRILKEGI